VIGMRPAVGFNVAMPQKCAGIRRLPPESVPSPQGDMPAAIAAASPPLLPPGDRWVSYGFSVRPWSSFSVVPPDPPGGQFVLPRRIAPAVRIRATMVASRSGRLSASSDMPSVVGIAAVSMTSFAVKGTPCRGPMRSPRASA
jgi:hypothetical protein